MRNQWNVKRRFLKPILKAMKAMKQGQRPLKLKTAYNNFIQPDAE